MDKLTLYSKRGGLTVKPVLDDGLCELTLNQGDQEFSIGFDDYQIIHGLLKKAFFDDTQTISVAGLINDTRVSFAGHLHKSFNTLYYSRDTRSITFFVLADDASVTASLEIERDDITDWLVQLAKMESNRRGKLH